MPVTPLSSEAVSDLISLTKQDHHDNEPNGMRRHRPIQKLSPAAERSLNRQPSVGLLKAESEEAKSNLVAFLVISEPRSPFPFLFFFFPELRLQ